jgi:hypothetical protein
MPCFIHPLSTLALGTKGGRYGLPREFEPISCEGYGFFYSGFPSGWKNHLAFLPFAPHHDRVRQRSSGQNAQSKARNR